MGTRLDDRTPPQGLPDLLTVEEAARLIRVGRTKAYAMAKEWRDSGGRAGLPVVDFGHVLRVPRAALEQLIGSALTGAHLSTTPTGDRSDNVANDNTARPATDHLLRTDQPRVRTRRKRSHSKQQSDQLPLFTSAPPSPDPHS